MASKSAFFLSFRSFHDDSWLAFGFFVHVWCWNNWTIQLKPIMHLCLINAAQFSSMSTSFSPSRESLVLCGLSLSWNATCDGGGALCLSPGFLSCPDVDAGFVEESESYSVTMHKNWAPLSISSNHTFTLIKLLRWTRSGVTVPPFYVLLWFSEVLLTVLP